eukprot:CAMPEP_0116878738 /NCGR_PEP_ID=MMETSP0463-20121206/10481_1 /TAXON_ID=181622 /ORGANISM="Strombidinopsis sp, Strain SopsisLIS2011" /LENGTH=101 /DNA_ID=CAMNT_0004527245 /DNA_START=38 /DNA_END=343 /DNA_ORIENTATION=-
MKRFAVVALFALAGAISLHEDNDNSQVDCLDDDDDCQEEQNIFETVSDKTDQFNQNVAERLDSLNESLETFQANAVETLDNVQASVNESVENYYNVQVERL